MSVALPGSWPDLVSGRVALGLLPLSIEGRPDEQAAAGVVRAAVDSGVRVVDAADVYGLADEPLGYSERLLGRVLAGLRQADRPVVATKGGLVRSPNGGREPNGRPDHLRRACEGSLRRLGVEVVDLYQLHRPDPAVPFAESLGGLRALVDAGLIRAAGVCNVSVDQLGTASDVLGDSLVAVQNRFSIDHRGEAGTLRHAVDRRLLFLAWAPLGGVGAGGGLVRRVPAAAGVAARHGVSPHRVALAWILAQGRLVFPLAGASTVEHVLDAVEAANLDLTAEDLADLDRDLPAGP